MPKINCDVCGKNYTLSAKQNYDLEKCGFLVYCNNCADKLKLTKQKAMRQGIKVYKM